MAEGLNRVMLLGNLGADPELRVTPGGQSILKLRLATTESYLDKNNTRQERTDWHRVTVWGKRGEALAKILAQGLDHLRRGAHPDLLLREERREALRTDIVANNIILTGRGRGGGAEQSYEGGGAARARHGGGGGSGGRRGSRAAAAGEDEPGRRFFGRCGLRDRRRHSVLNRFPAFASLAKSKAKH